MMSSCVLVRRSARQKSKRTANQTDFRHGGFCPPVPHRVIREIWVTLKCGILSSETLSHQISPRQRQRQQVERVSTSSTVDELVDHTCDGRRVVAGRSMIDIHSPRTRPPHQCSDFISSICCRFVVQLVPVYSALCSS